MKLTVLILAFILIPNLAYSTNIQLHYDYGEDRRFCTGTFEMFQPDKYGATYFFTDFDFNSAKNKSISLSYMELARYFKISGFDVFQPTLQYNDGIASFGKLGPAWLAGISRSFGAISIDLLYRHDSFSDGKDLQATLVWNHSFCSDFLLSGFVDVWTFGKEQKKLILLTEPQIWYNIWNNLNVGMEIELSSNFIEINKVAINPTIAFKWDFSEE